MTVGLLAWINAKAWRWRFAHAVGAIGITGCWHLPLVRLLAPAVIATGWYYHRDRRQADKHPDGWTRRNTLDVVAAAIGAVAGTLALRAWGPTWI